MDFLSYLRFKALGLILDYDSLDKDFFSKDKIVAARNVYVMNDVKLNCEYHRLEIRRILKEIFLANIIMNTIKNLSMKRNFITILRKSLMNFLIHSAKFLYVL